MNGWKMLDHVNGLLLDNNAKRVERSRMGFLERFYEGECIDLFETGFFILFSEQEETKRLYSLLPPVSYRPR
jgi:hypothetical protein